MGEGEQGWRKEGGRGQEEDGWTDGQMEGRTCAVVTEKGRQEYPGRWGGSLQAELCLQANQPLPLPEGLGSELRAVPFLLFLLPGGLLFRGLPDPRAGLGPFHRAWSSVWAAGPSSSQGGTCHRPLP